MLSSAVSQFCIPIRAHGKLGNHAVPGIHCIGMRVPRAAKYFQLFFFSIDDSISQVVKVTLKPLFNIVVDRLKKF